MADDKKKTTTTKKKTLRTNAVLGLLAALHDENKKIRSTRKAMREGGAQPKSKLKTHSDFLNLLMATGGYTSLQEAEAKWERVAKTIERDGYTVKMLPGVKKNKTAEAAALFPSLLRKKK